MLSQFVKIKMWMKLVFIIATSFLLEVNAVNLQSHRSNGPPQRSEFRSRWKRNAEAKCILPPQPDNGEYKVKGGKITDGTAAFIELEYSCNHFYEIVGGPNAFCWAGMWNAAERPRCVQTCTLKRHRSMQYNCIISGTDVTRPCKDSEADGTVIQPACLKPHYYAPLELPYMVCRNGHWNVWPTCVPECGLLTPKNQEGGRSRSSDVPWHAAIYYKNTVAARHEHICSGSLISNSVVLSAARCFWNKHTKQISDETNYAVAVGKLNSDWGNPDDEQFAQKSDVKKIAVPKQFRGEETNYQDDIAVVVVSRSFEYQLYLRPVCLDFRQELFEKHLKSGSVGKSGTWGASSDSEVSSKKLQVIDMPFIFHGDCISKTYADEQFCAGSGNGRTLCDSDAGSGIAFPATIQNTTRLYLRGVAAIGAEHVGASCNTSVAFTSIAKHQNLIKTYWYL